MDELVLVGLFVFLLPIVISIVAFNRSRASRELATELQDKLERLRMDHELLRVELELQQPDVKADNVKSSSIETDLNRQEAESTISKANADLAEDIISQSAIREEVELVYQAREEQPQITPEINEHDGRVTLAGDSSGDTNKFGNLISRIKKQLPEPVTRFINKVSPIALVGLAIVFVGLSFLLKLTYDAFSVPLWLKLTAVAAAGVGCTGLGWALRNKPNYFGVMLQGSGMAVLYLVTIAAGRYFSLISIELTFLVLTILVVITTLLALVQNTQILAILAAISGFAVPVLLSASEAGNHLILLGYYLLLNLGLVFLAYKKKWYFLEKSGVICTFILVESWLLFSYQPSLMMEVLPFLAGYFVLYFLLAHSHASDSFTNKNQVISNSLVFTLPLTSYGLFYTATESVSLATAYCSLFLFACYGLAAVATFKRQQNSQLVSVYKTFTLLFLALAIPAFFSATFTAAIYALKAATVLWSSNQQNRKRFALVGLGFLIASFYQLYQLSETLFYSTTITLWSWITPVMLVCLVLAYYASEWQFSYKTSRFSLAASKIRKAAMASVALVINFCWLWVGLTDANYLIAIQMLFVALLLFGSQRLARPRLSWSTLLLPVIVTLYFIATEFDHITFSGCAIIVSIALLFKTIFPVKPKVITLCVMAWLNVLLGLLVVIASDQAAWHSSLDVILMTYALATMLVSFVLYRITKWMPITQVFWLAPFWIVVLTIFVCSPHVQLEWMERGGLVVAMYALLYAFMKFDVNQVLIELVNKKSVIRQWIYVNHALHFWGVGLCCLAYSYQLFSWSKDETVLYLPWLSAVLVTVCYLSIVINKWPLKSYLALYQQLIVLPMVAVIATFMLYSLPIFEINLVSMGWLPILNPIELTIIAATIFVAVWLRQENTQIVFERYIKAQSTSRERVAVWLAISGVVFAHGALARGISFYTQIDYALASLADSGMFQAGLAILWSMIAMVATSIGSRLNLYKLWWAGAILFALTIIKLLIIDLSNRDTIVMVFAVIFVGVLMVLVGYFSPMPKRNAPQQ